MVFFTIIGAVKAAKQAKHEYEKDKKRNAVITPVEGSHDMLADRGNSSQQSSAPTDWWGTTRSPNAPPPSPDAPLNHAGAGAWSRDQVMQQISDAQAERPSSTYASSASASTELSAPIPRSHGPSATPSPSHLVNPSSPQRSPDVSLPASISRHSEERDRPHVVDDQQRESPTSPHINRGDESRHLRRDAPPVMNDGNGAGPPQRPKSMVQGSFEEALRRKPSVSEETMADTNPQRHGETISALARNASKGHRKKPSLVDNISAVERTTSNAPLTVPERVDGRVAGDAVSALARNASRGPRRRFERATKVSTTAGSFEESLESGSSREMVEGFAKAAREVVPTKVSTTAGSFEESLESGSSRETVGGFAKAAREVVVEQKCVSAFTGAATKKRVARRPPTNAQSSDVATAVRPSTGVASPSEPVTVAAAGPSGTVGSSMYAAGSMKKRTSRR